MNNACPYNNTQLFDANDFGLEAYAPAHDVMKLVRLTLEFFDAIFLGDVLFLLRLSTGISCLFCSISLAVSSPPDHGHPGNRASLSDQEFGKICLEDIFMFPLPPSIP